MENLRTRRLVSGTAWGYILFASGILYGLGSVPLALAHLSLAEFGLWAITQQIVGVLILLDLGFSSSFARILIDRAGDTSSRQYSEAIKAARTVMALQGLTVILAGLLASFFLPTFLNVEPQLKTNFFWLLAGQSAVVGIGFFSKVYSQVLYAHHRIDIESGIGTAGFLVQLLVLWVSLLFGVGVLSALTAAAAALGATTVARLATCKALKLMPVGSGGTADYCLVRQMFSFGTNLFSISLGNALLMSTQAIILAKLVGLTEAAIWSTCARPLTILIPLIWRPFDSSYTLLSEMVVRLEFRRLAKWFRSLCRLTLGLSLLAALIFALGNSAFVSIWTSGRVFWSDWNNILLAAWIPLLSVSHCRCWLIQATKQLKWLPFVVLAEGVFFVSSSALVGYRYGFTGIIVCSLMASLLFTIPYTRRRERSYFAQALHEDRGAVWTPLLIPGLSAGVLGLLSIVASWSADSALWSLIIRAPFVFLAAGILIRASADQSMIEKILELKPSLLKNSAIFFFGAQTRS